MALNKTLLVLSISYALHLDAMQQPAPNYSQSASNALIKIIRSERYGIDHEAKLTDVKNALREGADPNYSLTFNPHLNPAGLALSPEKMATRITITPLYEALNLKDKKLIDVLLNAGANPELKIST